MEGITEPSTGAGRTAYERLRERVEYRAYLDLIAESAADYAPASPATRRAFAEVQNLIYQAIVGMSAYELRTSGREIVVWTGKRGPTKHDRKVAKNYLSAQELRRMKSLVVLLMARAQLLSDDGHTLTLYSWVNIVRAELAVDIPLSPDASSRGATRRGRSSQGSASTLGSETRGTVSEPSKPTQPPRPGSRFSSRARQTRRRKR